MTIASGGSKRIASPGSEEKHEETGYSESLPKLEPDRSLVRCKPGNANSYQFELPEIRTDLQYSHRPPTPKAP